MNGKIIYMYSIIFCAIFFSDRGIAQKNPSDTVYNMVDVKPTFKGDLYAYLRKHLQYPEAAMDKGIEGTVYISFVITKTGEVADIEIEKGVSLGLDSEAVKVVKNMPVWVPGQQKGVFVNVRFHLPIKFSIDKRNLIVEDTVPLRNSAERRGFYVVPFGGIGWGGILFEQGNVPYDWPGNKFMVSGGGKVGYMFNQNTGFFSGVQLQKYTTKYTEGLSNYFYTNGPYNSTGSINDTEGSVSYLTSVTYSFTYVQIPLLFKYIGNKSGRTNLYIETGPLCGILLQATESGTITQEKQYISIEKGNTIYPYNASLIENANAVSKVGNANLLDWGFVLNLGIVFPVSARYSIGAEICNTYKFASVGNGGKDITMFGNTSFNYYQDNYGKAYSELLNINFLIHLGKIQSNAPGKK